MTEFNFFKPFLPVRKRRNYKKLISFILLLAFTIPVGYYHWTMLLQLNSTRMEIETVNTFLKEPNNLKKIEEIIQKQNTVDRYLSIRDQLLKSKAQINSEFKVAAYLLDLINDQIPNKLFLTKMTLSNGELSIEGYSESFETIAQYAYNLRMTGMFNEVLIPTVTKEDLVTSFTVKCNIKWEGMDEAE